MRAPQRTVVLFVAAALAMAALVGCGEEIPEVKEAFIIGITPHPDFPESGLVDFSILPKDEAGLAIINAGLDVVITAESPAETTVNTQSAMEIQPTPGTKLVAGLDLDSSGSMGSNDPQRLRVDAAKQFVDELDNNDHVGIFDFGGGKTDPFESTRLLADFTTDKLVAKSAIDQIKASGGTPMYKSVVEVLDYFNQQHAAGAANRALIVLGDGRPNSGGTLQACCDMAQATGIPINTIGFGPAADQSPRVSQKAVDTLRKLANCSGGAYSGVVEATALNQAFRNMGQATKSGSVVITVKFDPIPLSASKVDGQVRIGNGTQSAVALQYTFIAP